MFDMEKEPPSILEINKKRKEEFAFNVLMTFPYVGFIVAIIFSSIYGWNVDLICYAAMGFLILSMATAALLIPWTKNLNGLFDIDPNKSPDYYMRLCAIAKKDPVVAAYLKKVKKNGRLPVFAEMVSADEHALKYEMENDCKDSLN